MKFLVRWVADHEFTGPAQRTLHDIVATLISPELLPTGADGEIVQQTERPIGLVRPRKPARAERSLAVAESTRVAPSEAVC